MLSKSKTTLLLLSSGQKISSVDQSEQSTYSLRCMYDQPLQRKVHHGDENSSLQFHLGAQIIKDHGHRLFKVGQIFE